ncbi:diguanylate cyclase (GGDEF) domain-containing protein [Hathewaya proteolytica DSM 3090]|uniref:Stage 0 sporulation protein A homolog n=1 Tax=Hathewaya proteolytica DSM 3090 TaxID=1121331 RepID=A0A1M6S9Z2_9CLOT|nr:EAL domain-containing protein [Hathewaya proteolytica]SHK41521.1 diguanylate cyclase (GGDEF) domain-containing protein [Hathewaya proteolytica DSM 3090]
MASLKTLLIIDDVTLDSEDLCQALSRDCNLLRASNGKEALRNINDSDSSMIAIISNMAMPTMDVYISTLRKLAYLSDYDSLTGIYNKRKFYEVTTAMLHKYGSEKFVFVRFDINRFNLINAFYGMGEGDKLLKYIADKIMEHTSLQPKCTYGRMESDVFLLCFNYEGMERILEIVQLVKNELKVYNKNYDIAPNFGIYIIEDNYMPINIMEDKANLAAKKSKGDYINCFALYTEEMGNAIKLEQEITNSMNEALETEQFEVYLQPKYDVKTNMPVGAEALVRWCHPKKGIISPEDFVPVFERNGFIEKLDYFMWEKVCIILNRWIEEGKTPCAISVNVSRVNLYNPNLVNLISSLTEKYNIPNELLNLEITESAYMDNPSAMKKTMKAFRKKGFIIMMDDFGSGYSSLNILKDIMVDVLKIDMRFLSDTEIPGRGENIIASVVRMAKWLKIPTVAEGVEKSEQVDFLREIGCEYIQGYYYAEPMPVKKYEMLIEGKNQGYKKETHHEQFDVNTIWDINSEMNMLFSSVMQPVAIYEFDGKEVEILRVNDAYYDMFGYDSIVDHNNKIRVGVGLSDQASIIDAFVNVCRTKEVTECDYLRWIDKENHVWVNLKLKYITSVGNKHVLIGTSTDITLQKKMDVEIQKYKSMLNMKSLEAASILVVDDLEINREILKQMFKNKYRVIEASDGEEALKKLEENYRSVELILLDVLMPNMDGKEFLKYKNENKLYENIPVVVISAESDENLQINMLQLGVNDYISKPFVKEVVMRRIKNVLEYNSKFRGMMKEYEKLLNK